MRQDDFREQIAGLVHGLQATERVDRIRLYRFARDILRTGMVDLAEPRDRRGRARALLELEAAIRDFERAYRLNQAAALDKEFVTPEPVPPVPAADGSGLARVLGALVRRDIRLMLARDKFAYLWLFLAPALTIAAVLGSNHT